MYFQWIFLGCNHLEFKKECFFTLKIITFQLSSFVNENNKKSTLPFTIFPNVLKLFVFLYHEIDLFDHQLCHGHFERSIVFI